ncbi:MAG: glycosyltransferase family 4 protein [Bacteroidia bacterium]|nr:glycosyltransferase family 4 protein [Bacteroidia bacterium]MBP7244845.1 glycosyltransferase family 4 protein [Bacteroidia bacterium]
MLPLKILHIIWSTEMGGISKVVLHLCEEQQKDRDLQVSVFCAKGKSALFEAFEKKGISIFPGQFKGALQISNAAYKEVKMLMAKFDVLHFHSYNPVLGFAAKQIGKKLVYTEHGNFGIGRKKKLNDIIVGWMQKQFLNKRIDAITFNSEFTKSESIHRFGLSRTKKEVIYNGVPLNLNSTTSAHQFRKSEKEYLIVAIGRLAQVKRFDRLISAISTIPNSNFRLIIMGTGPEEMPLKNLVRDLKITDKVNFVGQGNSLQLIQESNLCVIPSQGEAFGLVAIEAYQQGKQVLVFEDGGGVTEIVKPLEPFSVLKNERELCELISTMIPDPTLETETKLNARKTYAAQFSMQMMSSKIKNIYLSI